jgi:nucleoside-diphosphate-sugar epimerase
LSKTTLIAGARGVVGQPLCGALERIGHRVIRVSRSDASSENKLKWDMANESLPVIGPIDAMVHCAPIWLLPDHLQSLADFGLKRLIAFSSSSILSKQNTQNPSEKMLVNLLRQGEQKTEAECNRLGIGLTIFRPSMIYGLGLDQNISRLARFIDRWGFAVVAGKADGLRQPVRSIDLVDAVIKVLYLPTTPGCVYTLAGSEALSYRDMLKRIFTALNKPTRIIGFPLPVYRFILRLAAVTGRFAYTAEMANRMNSNLAYDNAPAIADFGYTPSRFLQKPVHDLPDLLV